MKNTLDELTEEGTCCTKDFQCVAYFNDYLAHLGGIKEVKENKVHGPLYIEAIKKWAMDGRCVVSITHHINYNLIKFNRKPLPPFKGPIRRINLGLMSDEPLCAESRSNFST